jgi:hypothetical protein
MFFFFSNLCHSAACCFDLGSAFALAEVATTVAIASHHMLLKPLLRVWGLLL